MRELGRMEISERKTGVGHGLESLQCSPGNVTNVEIPLYFMLAPGQYVTPCRE